MEYILPFLQCTQCRDRVNRLKTDTHTVIITHTDSALHSLCKTHILLYTCRVESTITDWNSALCSISLSVGMTHTKFFNADEGRFRKWILARKP